MISTITSFVKAHNFNRIVLSLCGGRGETECQAKSDDLVVCLDSDRRSLFTGKFMARFMTGIKKNVIFSLFDYSHELFDFVRLVQLASNLPVILLFQHPLHPLPMKSREKHYKRQFMIVRNHCNLDTLHQYTSSLIAIVLLVKTPGHI